MKRSIILFGFVLLFSGCICCPVDTSSLFGSGDTSDDECPSPYISMDGECCIDKDSNGICDTEEYTQDYSLTPQTDQPDMTSTTFKSAAQTSTTIPPAPTLPAVTLIPAMPTTTTLKNAATYDCVKSAGGNPDAVYYLYSNTCGKSEVSSATTISARTGIDFVKFNIGGTGLTDEKISIISCFYGPYSEANQLYQNCPVLLCPKTGDLLILQARSGRISSQMGGFANKCI